MKKILVPTDFSSNAGKAQKQGIDLLAIVTHKRTFMESIFSGARQRKCVTIHQYHCWQYLQ